MDFSNLMKTGYRYIRVPLALTIILFHLSLLHEGGAEAAQATNETTVATSESEKLSFENALRDERSDLANMEQRLDRWEQLKNKTISEIDAYHIQNVAHENLLLVLNTQIESLETALNNNRLAIKSLSERVVEFEKIGNIAPNWMARLSDRISIAEKRLAELNQEKTTVAGSPEISAQLKSLLGILLEKKKRGEIFLNNYSELFDR
jgi:potassium-dependent mechanosensitive channel